MRMCNLGLLLVFSLLIFAAAMTLACGSHSSHTLESVTVTPATADAQQSGGQVQFTATGVFNTMPSPVTPLGATWEVCSQGLPTTQASISNNGSARCMAGASGMFHVVASDTPNGPFACPADLGCGGGCTVSGTAQLTCP